MEQLKLYYIDMKYVRDLHNADDRVDSVSPQIGKENRVFIGVVVTHNDRKYCIPLSHPKEKHKRMANNAELHKIEVEGKLIGVLNFNLMIPVTDAQLIPVDLRIHKNDTLTKKAWKRLCIKELNWCRKGGNDKLIRDKAKNLFLLCTSDTAFNGKKRCLDYIRLEKVCDKYNSKINGKTFSGYDEK
ncbi:protein AbiQ [Butyrivibrio sp. INlla18]|uniref:type III toxin-antitoxin system ToxN/AbiQ family toxin n=1 Tax=Butyrivibrio sp. INlla18 TaxID=1520806 RepID=UPI000884E332|nr:type III toxin-antitoxin system ToxN/AbiQ family toxin [Butyrivibrio sp. INlla18]SDA55475.1 protein AbiQ [Butyrivibrio sp. INlla18]